ncbi:unnamed protein product [Rotaria socialis]|uniref:Uncharacterized protein n=1 Tax=Rotaria socialis TaxID=392032 RepID=A0A821KFR4_9BILA|nr:unnamed protein product [Rotaria socialis]CAF4735369.1 unnamed protein product [Rotaria socialis]
MRIQTLLIQTNTPLMEDTQVHERHAIKQSGLDEKSVRIIYECSLNQDVRDIADDAQISELVFKKEDSFRTC